MIENHGYVDTIIMMLEIHNCSALVHTDTGYGGLLIVHSFYKDKGGCCPYTLLCNALF